jgi:hypothetical protein
VIITDLGGQEYELTETRLSELPIEKATLRTVLGNYIDDSLTLSEQSD